MILIGKKEWSPRAGRVFRKGDVGVVHFVGHGPVPESGCLPLEAVSGVCGNGHRLMQPLLLTCLALAVDEPDERLFRLNVLRNSALLFAGELLESSTQLEAHHLRLPLKPGDTVTLELERDWDAWPGISSFRNVKAMLELEA